MSNKNLNYVVVILLVFLIAVNVFFGLNPDPLVEQGLMGAGVTNFDSITLSENLLVTGTSGFTGAMTAGAITATGAVGSSGTNTLGVISQTINTENVMLPTVLSVSIDIDNDSSPFVCATVTDGEVWFIHRVFVNVLDNFATGGSNDATFDVGDGGDQDGFLDLDDGELQTADTEGTGAPAGWQGFMSTDTRGVYLASTPTFPYAPSGADETIDCTFAGTGLASDTADTDPDITVYIVYTRIQ